MPMFFYEPQPVQPSQTLPSVTPGNLASLFQDWTSFLAPLLQSLSQFNSGGMPRLLSGQLPNSNNRMPNNTTANPWTQPALTTPPTPTSTTPTSTAPTSTTSTTSVPSTTSTTAPGSTVRTISEAARNTSPKFMPVLRGDEKQKDAAIKTQADFGRAADQVAREYGIDPNLFRAQLQVESGAFTRPFQDAMKHEGDLSRGDNSSIGLGQISRKFLDGREWADGGPGNERVGSQVVTTDQYTNSPTVQLRMAASNLAQRIADHGGLEQGLAYYVSGNPDPGNSSAQQYLSKISQALQDPQVTDVGRG